MLVPIYFINLQNKIYYDRDSELIQQYAFGTAELVPYSNLHDFYDDNYAFSHNDIESHERWAHSRRHYVPLLWTRIVHILCVCLKGITKETYDETDALLIWSPSSVLENNTNVLQAALPSECAMWDLAMWTTSSAD